MLGKASEIKVKQISWTPPFTFNLDDYSKHKTLGQKLDEWLKAHPDYIIESIQFDFESKYQHVFIVYKEE